MTNPDNHKVSELPKSTQPHIDPVPIVTNIVAPVATHLSTCFEQLWLSCRPGHCGGNGFDENVAKRRATNAIVSAWCTMESAVNLALYHRLKNTDCGYYIPVEDRTIIDREIADKLNSSLPFEKRYDYIQESSGCNCTTLKNYKGKVLQFEKLRNTLLHGYVKKRDTMLSLLPEQPDLPEEYSGSSDEIKAFRVESEEYITPDGKVEKEWVKQFSELGLRHDPTKLCRHDAAVCIAVMIRVLEWLERHYGIHFHAAWKAHKKQYLFVSQRQTTTQGKGIWLVGFQSLWDAFTEKDNLERTTVDG